MSNTTDSVPVAYRIFFRYLDPLTALYGVYLNILAPQLAVTGPAPNSTYDPDQVFLFYQTAGLALAIAFIVASIHRYSNDLIVWRLVQFALLLADFVALAGIYLSLDRQGRLAPSSWSDDDRGLVSTYCVLTAIRLAFILRLGFGKTAGKP